ncbi:outer membrane protein assembly factor BamD [candidate division KSB3 bacterium]|uniref:Outer membrane protein assembly factor BamD n=1 Tax=candidate division KSB3 bacterium TaxID=2044937 RepID=A0A9D5Q7H3_9BACT|nr:outer membrane protein assembly factor BamD [candidate division KSB3 bacterium]MBD3326443.1 outer membrane protein assembly factor BamD [candidate division KSB3 bacterium]
MEHHLMQQHTHRLLTSGALLLIALALLGGCGSSTNLMETQTDTELFEQGKALYEQGDYDTALEYFLYVKDHFLRSPYAGVTRFYAGECYFGLEQYEDAVIEYKSFLSFFPNDPNAPAAQYKLGVSYLKQALGPDRDQSTIQKALTELQNVRTLYPESTEYIQKAAEKLRETRHELALHEFLVAEFYRNEKLYASSNHRLTYLMNEYPDTSFMGDALFMMGRNYLDLDQPDQAAEAFTALIQQYPDDEHVSTAQQQLADLGVSEIPQPDAQASTSSPPVVPPAATASEPPSPPASPQGYVVLKRDNRIFTDLIREDGIREGMLLEVYRQDELIGTIRIIEIQEGFSIAEVESLRSERTIQEEDRVCCPQTQ